MAKRYSFIKSITQNSRHLRPKLTLNWVPFFDKQNKSSNQGDTIDLVVITNFFTLALFHMTSLDRFPTLSSNLISLTLLNPF